MKRTIRVIAAAVIATTIETVRADDNAELIRRLQQQVQSLDQKVKALEGKEADDVAAIEERAKASPTLTIGERGIVSRQPENVFFTRVQLAF